MPLAPPAADEPRRGLAGRRVLRVADVFLPLLTGRHFYASADQIPEDARIVDCRMVYRCGEPREAELVLESAAWDAIALPDGAYPEITPIFTLVAAPKTDTPN